jgi:hypothetical protein
MSSGIMLKGLPPHELRHHGEGPAGQEHEACESFTEAGIAVLDTSWHMRAEDSKPWSSGH